MRFLVRALLVLVLLGLVAGGGAWFWAGRAVGPTIDVRQPAQVIGQATTLDLKIEAPDGRVSRVEVTLEQNGTTHPVFSLDDPASTQSDTPSPALYVMRPVGKQAVPALQAGPVRLVVRASRPVLFGLRRAESSVTRDLTVRLEPPRVAVLSTFHYINHGGAEFVVFRATPADASAGVKVGTEVYPAFPGSAVGIQDPAVRVAFFALLPDQALGTPIEVFAKDPSGAEAVAAVDHQAFEKPFGKSRIPVDSWVARVVPPIVANTPELKLSTEPDQIVNSFVRINSDLRKQNGQTITALSTKTEPKKLWTGAFQALSNAAVEAKFADYRTYLYQGKEIDQQVHLGFDLAVTAQVPVTAAQDGVVVHAAYLGIYGNCVIVDHGLGVQSLYGHLSSIGVKPGDRVTKGQTLGRSGTTGLAAGDHLHFTMLVDGRAVNPVEWWDQKWMQDRVLRKIAEAGGV